MIGITHTRLGGREVCNRRLRISLNPFLDSSFRIHSNGLSALPSICNTDHLHGSLRLDRVVLCDSDGSVEMGLQADKDYRNPCFLRSLVHGAGIGRDLKLREASKLYRLVDPDIAYGCYADFLPGRRGVGGRILEGPVHGPEDKVQRGPSAVHNLGYLSRRNGVPSIRSLFPFQGDDFLLTGLLPLDRRFLGLLLSSVGVHEELCSFGDYTLGLEFRDNLSKFETTGFDPMNDHFRDFQLGRFGN